MYSRKQTVAPLIEPITRSDFKTHARVDSDLTAEDSYIDALIQASRQYCEEYTRRGFITQTWEAKLHDFEDEMVLTPSVLQSVSSIAYTDADNASQTLAASVYDVDTHSVPGRVTLDPDESWPSVRNQRHAVTITYVVGYGDAASDVPEAIKQAILLLAAHWYENREPVAYSTPSEVPFTVKALLDMYRISEV